MADALRGSMDAAEYKHVVLGLIFLKYISDAFEEQHAKLEAERAQGADPEDPDEYRALSIFWVPPEARWSHLKAQAKQPTIGQLVDDAMSGIERDNASLKGVLPKDYARPALDKQRLGQLIDLISNIKVGDAEARSKDVLGRIYDLSIFSEQFAQRGRQKGRGVLDAAQRVVQLAGRDDRTLQRPCLRPLLRLVRRGCSCSRSSSSMPTRAATETAARPRALSDLRPRMQLHHLAPRENESRDARHRRPDRSRRHFSKGSGFILANPQFNVTDWGGDRLRDDKRWQFGKPPVGNANDRFAYAFHVVFGCSTSSIISRPPARRLRPRQRLHVVKPIRRRRNPKEHHRSRSRGLHDRPSRPALLLDADSRVSVVPHPRQIRSSFPRKRESGFRDRRGQVLFIDARKLGRMVDRTHRELRYTQKHNRSRPCRLHDRPARTALLLG